MPQVRDLMTADPQTAPVDASLEQVARLMRDRGVGAVPLVDGGQRPVGIVTDRDIVVRVLAEGRDPSTVTIGDACSQQLVTVDAGQDAGEAVKAIREADVQRVVVLEDGQLAGIVTLGDLAEHLDEDSALADLSAEPPNN